MNRSVQNGIIAIVGVIVITATANGLYLNFVKPALQIPLFVAGGILVAFALHGTYAAEWRRRPVSGPPGGDDPDDPQDPDDHGHDHLPRVGWLVLVPFLILGIAAPPPLGSYSAQQDSGLVSSIQSAEGLAPLPAGDPVSLPLTEYSGYALYSGPEVMDGRTFRLQGFVTTAATTEGWALTRMALSCCAADGYAVKVDVRGGPRLPDDTWVEVEGTWLATPEPGTPGVAVALPILQATSVREIPRPKNPYD